MFEQALENVDRTLQIRSLVKKDVGPGFEAGDVAGKDHHERRVVFMSDRADEIHTALSEQIYIEHDYIGSESADGRYCIGKVIRLADDFKIRQFAEGRCQSLAEQV